jgi:signal transduction histidine kinase
VALVVEDRGEQQAGFLIYLPVYASTASTLGERHATVAGWIFAPFRVTDLVLATLGDVTPWELDLELFDGAEPTPGALMFDGDGSRTAGAGRSRLVRVEVAGRTWTLRFTAGEDFVQRWERWLPRVVLATGLLLTALLFWVSREEARALARAESASLRAGFLAEAGRILASSLDYPRTLQQVSLLAASRVADGCVMYVQEPGGVPLWLAGFPDKALARNAVDSLRASAGAADPQAGPAAVLRSERPEVRNDVDLAFEPLFERDPALLTLQRRAGTRHVLTVPLFARGEPLGTITLTSVRLRFDQADVAMAEDLARLAVSAIDTGRLYRRAQHSLRLRDEFLSIASHELKTPLTSLGLQAESLRVQAGRAPPEVVVRKTDSIRRNLERLNRLVATMLDLSRITSGRLELDLEELELGEVAREVASRFEDEAARAGCELRVEAQEPVVGIWDRLRVDQVLTNLVSNALKYGPGKPVDVRVFARGDRAVLEVRDQGIGIGAEDQDRIFERFERAVSERNYGGFGLGLWIVRRIVEALGGTVTVESAAGSGATFTVELRREPEHELRDRGPLEPRIQA